MLLPGASTTVYYNTYTGPYIEKVIPHSLNWRKRTRKLTIYLLWQKINAWLAFSVSWISDRPRILLYTVNQTSIIFYRFFDVPQPIPYTWYLQMRKNNVLTGSNYVIFQNCVFQIYCLNRTLPPWRVCGHFPYVCS